MLAEERQPDPEHARGAFDHHLEQTPGVGARMEAHRQMQHVFEKGGDDRDAVAAPRPGPGGRCESRSECRPTATLATMLKMPNATQAASEGPMPLHRSGAP